MASKITFLLGVLTFIHSTVGGRLHGVAYSAVSTPVHYGRIAPYSASVIANPVAATYSTRYTAYAAVPLAASPPALTGRQHVGGFVRAFAAPSFSRHSGFSNGLIRQGVSAYAAVPIAGYRVSFGGPAVRSYGVSLRSFPTALSVQGLYPSPAGFDDYVDPLLNEQRTFGSFDDENPLSVW